LQSTVEKKAHTLKNTVISNSDKEVLFLGKTVAGGKNHDMGLFKTEFKGKEDWFMNQNLGLDLGYIGVDKIIKAKRIYIPNKRPKKSKNVLNPVLSKEQILYNSMVSCIRVPVENTLAGVKRGFVLKNKLRSSREIMEDTTIEIAAGIWNFHLSFVRKK
jgi:hypothetical protein